MRTETALYETTRCLCLASRRAARLITRTFDQALRAHGIRATQFTLLAALTLAGPMSIGDLAELLAADRTTVSRNLSLVQQRELVSIKAGKDARARIASITPAGRALLAEALPTWRKTQKQLTEDLGDQAALGLQRLAGGPCVMPLPDEFPT
jgi:DNA-binding MarR family transcriptional regulator